MEIGGGDGFTTKWIYLAQLNSTLKNSQDDKFYMMSISLQLKIKRKGVIV